MVVAYNQYVVFGCSVKLSVVVNVIEFHGTVTALRSVVRVVKHGLAGDGPVVGPYGDVWTGSACSACCG